jgi:inorganic triphosphatase YgiF
MRVGLRRLRAAMSLFKELIEQPDSEHIESELKWLTEQLGAARDLDVLLKEGVRPLEQEEPEARESQRLLSALAWDFWSFAFFRMITGLGIGGEYAAVNSAIDELIPANIGGGLT